MPNPLTSPNTPPPDNEGLSPELERAFLDLVSATEAEEEEAPDFGALQKELEQPQRLRELPVRWRMSLVIALMIAFIGLLFVFTSNSGDITASFLLGSAALLTSIILGLTASLRPLYKPPLQPGLRWGWLGLNLGFLVVLVLGPVQVGLVSAGAMPAGALGPELGCFLSAIAASTPIFLIWWFFHRAGYKALWHVAFAAVSASLVGFLCLNFKCGAGDSFHLGVAHLGSVIVFSALVVGIALLLPKKNRNA